MPRAVLDSSVLISAFLTPHGTSAPALNAREAYVLCLSPEILDETAGKLHDKAERLQKRYAYTASDIARYISLLSIGAELTGELPILRAVPGDPKDDIIVATAVAANAGYLVTGDRKHLLSLGAYGGIEIISPRAFLDLLSINY